jgi:hypothetical protein
VFILSSLLSPVFSLANYRRVSFRGSALLPVGETLTDEGGTTRVISAISACGWDPKQAGSVLLLNDESEVHTLLSRLASAAQHNLHIL